MRPGNLSHDLTQISYSGAKLTSLNFSQHQNMTKKVEISVRSSFLKKELKSIYRVFCYGYCLCAHEQNAAHPSPPNIIVSDEQRHLKWEEEMGHLFKLSLLLDLIGSRWGWGLAIQGRASTGLPLTAEWWWLKRDLGLSCSLVCPRVSFLLSVHCRAHIRTVYFSNIKHTQEQKHTQPGLWNVSRSLPETPV